MSEIVVSVVMTVYNHEKYIEKAIKSVLEQENDFKYELLIGEDCSTDNSLSIIQKYKERYPDIIRVFTHDKNIGGQKNVYELYMNSRGKYIAILEGDDFWCSSQKMKKQVDFLENHSEYIACAHRFKVVDEKELNYFDKDFECQFYQNNPYTKEILERGQMLSHVNTLMFRNIFINKNIHTDFLNEFNDLSGDYTLTALLVLNGKMYCMPEYFSCYRKVVAANSSSFSSIQERNNKRDVLFQSAVDLENILNQQYCINCEARKKSIFASAVFKWYREPNHWNFRVVQKIIKKSNKPIKYSMWFGYLIIYRMVLNIQGKKNQRVPF